MVDLRKFAGGELPAPGRVPAGTGKTSGRGMNGQKSRAGGGKGAGFEGGQTPLARRLPKLPGFKNINHVEYLPVNVKRLEETFEAGDEVNRESLKAKGIIKHADALVKVLGDGEITAGQDSYWVSTRGGGHGDKRLLVLAPASVQECADLTYLAFDLAEKYRNVVEILSDGAICQMIEKCYMPEAKEHDIDKFDWALTGKPRGVKKNNAYNVSWYQGYETYNPEMREKFKTMFENEQRWEEFMVEDAELVLVAYGISSRVCRSAVRQARKEGMKLGLLRPITVWPFPRKAFEKMPAGVKGYVSVEMSLTAQMGQDIILASRNDRPVYGHLTAKELPTVEGIIEYCSKVMAGDADPVEVY